MFRLPSTPVARLSSGPGRGIAAALLVLLLPGCADERAALTTAPTGALDPVSTYTVTGSSSELVLELSTGADPLGVWNEYDLLPLEVMRDGRTWRTRVDGSGRTVPETIALMRDDTRVGYAEENVQVKTPTLQQSSVSFNEGFLLPGEYLGQSAAHRLRLAEAHVVSRGYGVTIAILDTGIDMDHPVLAGRIHEASYDFVDHDSDPSEAPDGIDDDADGLVDEALGHGSHVAGLAALVAPGARIMALRVLSNDGTGTSYGLASAIEYAVNKGARVINLSLRLSVTSAAVDRALTLAASRGVLVVAAAGNTAVYGPLEYPASDPRVVAVGSLDAAGRRSWFSAWSASIALSSPGENLLSIGWNGGYAVWSGTSMAAPLVTGTAALLMSTHLRLTADQARARLTASVEAWRGTTYGMGAGIVAPWRAVGTLSNAASPPSAILPSQRLHD